jgi:hypothetical protein
MAKIAISGNELDGADHAGGQKDNSRYQFQHAVHSDADDTEGQQQQPDDGIGNQSEQGQRPAKEKENTPE